jgi:hypothetical protein
MLCARLLNVAVLVAGSACSVPLSSSLRAGSAAGTARVQPWWGEVNVGAVAGTKGTGAARDRSRTDFSDRRVRAGSAERGEVMLRSGAGSRISLPRWRDPSVVCRQETSTVAGQ